MNIPEGYKLLPVEPTDMMVRLASWAIGPGGDERLKRKLRTAYAHMLDAAPTPPAFDGEPPVIAYAAFADNGNIRCWSRTNEAVGLKVLEEGGSRIVELIDREQLRFHVQASEHVEAHLTQQIDILTIDLKAARERIARMTSALEMVATLRGTLEQHGMLEQVQEALGPRHEAAPIYTPPNIKSGCPHNSGGAHNSKGPLDSEGNLSCTCGLNWESPF